MKWHWAIIPGLALMLSACQPAQPIAASIAADGRIFRETARTRVPRSLLQLAGVGTIPGSQILNRGYVVDGDSPVPAGQTIHLQIRPPVQVLLNGQSLQTFARTVGEALDDSGIDLFLADLLDPPADAPVSAGLAITHVPSRVLNVAVDGSSIRLRSAPIRTGVAFAQAGVPVIGLDSPKPYEGAELPEDGRIGLSRESEALLLVQDPIPFDTRSEDSSELELGMEQVLEAGRGGLAVTRTRLRYVEGIEVSRQVEPQVVVRAPQDRVVVRGTKLVEKTVSLDGLSIKYWRVLQMFATVYSPCNSGTAGYCSTGTASGLPAGKGVVAVDPDLFSYLNGQRLYIPGYGYAVIGDVGGGYIIEQNLGISRYKWIDLGFDDDNIQDMTGWVTVYFLAPAPASVPEVLQ